MADKRSHGPSTVDLHGPGASSRCSFSVSARRTARRVVPFSLIRDQVGDGSGEPCLTQQEDDLASMVGTVIGHVVQHIMEALLESLTVAVAIGDGAPEVVGRHLGEEGAPALGARFDEGR